MIFYLYGEDTFRSRQKLGQIKSKFRNDVDAQGLNVEVLVGEKLDAADFSQAVKAAPFLSAKRLVVVENVLAQNKKKALHETMLAQLSSGLPETTVLVIREEGEPKAGAKTAAGKLITLLKKQRFAQKFDLLAPAGVQRFIDETCTAKGASITPDARRLLAEIVGNDLWKASHETEKLIAYANHRPISKDDIAMLTIGQLDNNIFALTDALGQKRRAQALALIADQLTLGTNPLELLAKVSWQFKNLVLVKSFSEQNGPGYPPARVAAQLGLHPFVARKTLEQARHFSLEQLKKNYQHLLAIDRNLKTSHATPEVLFDLFIVQS